MEPEVVGSRCRPQSASAGSSREFVGNRSCPQSTGRRVSQAPMAESEESQHVARSRRESQLPAERRSRKSLLARIAPAGESAERRWQNQQRVSIQPEVAGSRSCPQSTGRRVSQAPVAESAENQHAAGSRCCPQSAGSRISRESACSRKSQSAAVGSRRESQLPAKHRQESQPSAGGRISRESACSRKSQGISSSYSGNR